MVVITQVWEWQGPCGQELILFSCLLFWLMSGNYSNHQVCLRQQIITYCLDTRIIAAAINSSAAAKQQLFLLQSKNSCYKVTLLLLQSSSLSCCKVRTFAAKWFCCCCKAAAYLAAKWEQLLQSDSVVAAKQQLILLQSKYTCCTASTLAAKQLGLCRFNFWSCCRAFLNLLYRWTNEVAGVHPCQVIWSRKRFKLSGLVICWILSSEGWLVSSTLKNLLVFQGRLPWMITLCNPLLRSKDPTRLFINKSQSLQSCAVWQRLCTQKGQL